MIRRRWRRRRPLSAKTGPRLLLLILLLALVTSCISGYREILEMVALYGESHCRNLVTQLVLDAAAETKTAEKLSSFTETDGKSLITLDGDAVRQYQVAVGKTLTQRLETLQEQSWKIPIGTVIGGVLLMERGPQVELRFVPVGSAQVTVDSSLEEAGVNQVLYRVLLELSVDMKVVAPGSIRTVSCDQQVILEEVLLTGQVPLVYGE